MGNEKKFSPLNYLTVLLLAIPVSLILNWDAAASLFATLTAALMPVFYGVAIALILNAPLGRLEALAERLDRKGRLGQSAYTGIAMVCLIVLLAAVVYTLVTALVPQVVRMFDAVVAYLKTNDLQQKLREALKISPEDWDTRVKTWIDTVTGQVGTYIRDGLNSVVSVTSSFVQLLIALTIALYILASRHSLHRQFRRVACALLPERSAALLNHTADLTVQTVSTWFGHQMLEGIIFGCVMAVVMMALRLPYVVPVSFLSACLYMIPYFGSWLTFFMGFLIMLSVDLRTAVIFGVMLLVLQFLDGNFLNPRLVGGSIGLPPWLALASISIFGVLFGLPGMLLGVPAAAVLVALTRDLVHTREKNKQREAQRENT